MNIAPAVYDLLRNDATVAGYVGTRIYPDQIPQEAAYPAIVHFKTEVETLAVKSAPTTNHRISLQIEVFCDTFGEGENIADAIRSVLDGYSGISAGINIVSCYFNSQNDENFIPDQKTYVTTASYLFRVVI